MGFTSCNMKKPVNHSVCSPKQRRMTQVISLHYQRKVFVGVLSRPTSKRPMSRSAQENARKSMMEKQPCAFVKEISAMTAPFNDRSMIYGLDMASRRAESNGKRAPLARTASSSRNDGDSNKLDVLSVFANAQWD